MKKPALIVLLLWLAVMLVVGFTDAKAQPLTHYQVGACFDRVWDPWTIDTVFFIVFDGSSGAVDSGLAVSIDTARYAGRTDSLCFTAGVLSSQISAVRNPWGMFVVDVDYGGGVIKRFKQVVDIVHGIHSVDTARYSFATATVDYDSIADIINAACGGGTGINVVRVYARDTTNDVNVNGVLLALYNMDAVTLEGQGITEAPGYFDFSLDDATYLGRVHTPPGYLMETANDTIVVLGPTQDTIELFAMTFAPLSGGDSCNVVIFTDVPFAKVKIAMEGLGREDKGKPIKDTSGVWLDPFVRPDPEADQFGVLVVPMVRSQATRPNSCYDIKILNKYGQQMVVFEDYAVPNQALDTLR